MRWIFCFVDLQMADHQHQQQLRAAQKRKYDLEDDITSQMPPRIGMG